MSEQPVTDSNSLKGPDKMVYHVNDRPLETPIKEIEKGVLYKNSDEALFDNPYGEFNDSKSVEGAVIPEGDADLAVDRRGFLKAFSLSSAAVGATSCIRRPEEKVVPYLKQPAGFVQGVAKYYTSVCKMCPAGCGIKVKTHEGRPVKIEGLEGHPISNGKSCALGQASIQGLYHPDRLPAPIIRRKNSTADASWEEVWQYLGLRLKGKKNIGIVTGATSESQRELFELFLSKMGQNTENVFSFDSNNLFSQKVKAHEIAFGTSDYSRHDFSKANYVVSIGSDFLSTGTHSVLFARQFAEGRKDEKRVKHHTLVFESGLTSTGSRADKRVIVPIGSELSIAMALLASLAANKKARGSASELEMAKAVVAQNSAAVKQGLEVLGQSVDLDKVTEELLVSDGVFACGSSHNFDQNGTKLQLAEILLNTLIGAYGKTVFINEGAFKAPFKSVGDLERFRKVGNDLDALIVIETDPLFTVPESFGLKKLFKSIEQIVSIQSKPTLTDEFAHTLIPANHYLESWGENENYAGSWSIQQPAVRATQNSVQAEDALFWIAAYSDKPLGHKDYFSFLKVFLKSKIKFLNGASTEMALAPIQRQGFTGLAAKSNISPMSPNVSKNLTVSPVATGAMTLSAVLDPRLKDGVGSHLPALQEAGDPLTSITWDSWLAINPNSAKELGLRRFDEVEVKTGAGSLTVGVWPQPGLHKKALFIHRGNGVAFKASRVAAGIGVDPLPLMAYATDPLSGTPVTNAKVSVNKTGKRIRIVSMQKPTSDLGNRDAIVNKTSRKDLPKVLAKKKNFDHAPDLYPQLPVGDYTWGMSVDLDSCHGCSACMVACAVENNVPQIGRKLVGMGREMHWIRLDIYFQGPVDNPQVTTQPMMCQQCNHAPCEAVCPVYATTHDNEGLNTQTYNRCVGTRYCANACPYKVRRFNWFTHKWNEPLNPRPLNPDVTVRTKGIMEKCTFCIQRITEGKIKAGDTPGVRVPDGSIKTACQQACPSDAIHFGDLQDKNSVIHEKRHSGRSYLALNGDHDHHHYGIKTLPNVNYLSQVVEKAPKGAHHHESEGGNHHG